MTASCSPAGTLVRWNGLASAFVSERRLLGDLLRVLLDQRKALAANDLEALNDAVHAAQRVLLTVHESKRHRNTLLRHVFGGDEPPLEELELWGDVPSDVLEARDRLLDGAAELRRELGINRRAIRGAIHVGEGLIQALAGGAPTLPLYQRGSDHPSRGAPGVLIDREG